MGNHRHDVETPSSPVTVPAAVWRQLSSRRSAPGRTLAALLLAGTAACTSSPQYPIRQGERPGDGSVMAVQPQYPISARDAAEDAHDRASQAGYPAYGAPPVSGAQAPVYAAPPAQTVAPPVDDGSDDAPRPLHNAPVDSADLPPPDAAPPPPPPREDTIAFGGGQLVFGMDDAGPRALEFAAYHHRRHHAEVQPADAASPSTLATPTAASAAAAPAEATPPSPGRHRRRHAQEAAASSAAPEPAADTPYQTVVRPGEKLADVAERVHSSKDALSQLNDLKHPRHVKPGTVLKVPYSYSYQVQKGDTLYTISHRFNQDPEAMAKLNRLKAVPTLQPGQTIALPASAEDTGKRDHATASGPSPVAAPEKLADVALGKESRHGRGRHAAEAVAANAPAATPAAAAAAPEPAKLSRAERRRLRREEKAGRLAAVAPPEAAPAASQPVSEPPVRLSRAERRRLRREGKTSPPSTAPAILAQASPTASSAYASPQTTPLAIPSPTAPAQAYASTAPAVPAAPPPTPHDVQPRRMPPQAPTSIAAAGGGGPSAQPYYAGVRPPAPTSGAPATGVAGARSASSGVAASTYAAPGYTPRATAALGASRLASLTPPRYTAPSTGAYAPSLGRERPLAPLTAGAGAAATGSEIAAAGRGRFIWPLRGPLVSGFGAKGTGEYNNGMDIAAPPGTGVRAAAGGEVAYAGSSIPGYGNMVLIKHTGGWVTAYAHLNRLEVRMHDTVSQGDEIGQAGQTGVVDRPELYFEVRYANGATERPRPVDPALVLPAG